jgi:hypothetical protein
VKPAWNGHEFLGGQNVIIQQKVRNMTISAQMTTTTKLRPPTTKLRPTTVDTTGTGTPLEIWLPLDLPLAAIGYYWVLLVTTGTPLVTIGSCYFNSDLRPLPQWEPVVNPMVTSGVPVEFQFRII